MATPQIEIGEDINQRSIEQPTIELVTKGGKQTCPPPCGESGCRPDSSCHPDCTP